MYPAFKATAFGNRIWPTLFAACRIGPNANSNAICFATVRPCDGVKSKARFPEPCFLGSSGQLRAHDLMPSPDTAKGFDTDQAFMLVEVVGKEFHFQTISRAGNTVDQGQFDV
jgi:hypothetical protein